MNWFYAEAGERKGPISEEQLDGLAKTGAIQPDTLVWRDGLANWQPYREARAAVAPPPLATPTTGGLCSQCGKNFAADEVVSLGGALVCAACKPIVLQGMKEGVGAKSGPGGRSLEELLGGDYDSPVTSCMGRGWSFYRANFLVLLGTTFLVGLVSLVANGIPWLGILIGMVLNGPITGGLWHFYVRKIRGEEVGVSDAFGGFGPQFVNLMLANIVITVFSYLCLLPGGVVFGLGMLVGTASRSGVAMTGAAIVGGFLFLLGWLAMIYLATSWLFTVVLVIDKKMDFWPAMMFGRKMVGKHWWSNFGLMFCLGLVVAMPIGILVIGAAFFVGASGMGGGGMPPMAAILAIVGGVIMAMIWVGLAAPWTMSSLAHRYQDIFGQLTVKEG